MVISPDDARAYVTNRVDATVSVIDLNASQPSVLGNIEVRTEPRGLVISLNGQYVSVANFTEGTVSVIATSHSEVVNTVDVGGNPMAMVMSNVVRAPIMPDIEDPLVPNSGRSTFETYCGACHNGAKWTKSSTAFYQNDPTFNINPIGADFFAGVTPIDPNLTVAGPQIRAINFNGGTFNFLENVGTLFEDNELEIRGAGAIAGQTTQGFNVPSLLGVGISAP